MTARESSRAIRMRRITMLLLVLAATLRVQHLAHMAPTAFSTLHTQFDQSDQYLFDQWARRIVAGDVLGRQPFRIWMRWQLSLAPIEKWRQWYGEGTAYLKAPLYAYLVALARACCGDPWLPVSLLQILASTLSVFLLIRITEQLFGRGAALWAGAVFALYAPAIHFDIVLLRAPWTVMAALLVTWQLARISKRPSNARMLVLGVTVGGALLLREIFLPLALLLPPCLAAGSPGTRAAIRRIALFYAGFFAAVAPLIVRNVVVGAPPFRLAAMGTTAYAVCNTSFSHPTFFEVHAEIASILAQSGSSLLTTAKACLATFHGPWHVAGFYSRRALGLVIPFEAPDNANFYFAALYSPLLKILPGYGLLFPLALAGAFLSRRRLAALLILGPAILVVLASILLTLPMSRYRVVFAALLVPFAGHMLDRMTAWTRERRWPLLVASAAFLACVGGGAQLAESRLVFSGRNPDSARFRPPEFILEMRHRAERNEIEAALHAAFLLARLNPDASVKTHALLGAAYYHFLLGQTPAVADALSSARGVAERRPDLLLAVGDAYVQLLDARVKAADVFEEALRDAPPDVEKALKRRLDDIRNAALSAPPRHAR